MKRALFALICLFIIVGCTKDRNTNIQYFKDHIGPVDTTGGTTGTVLINEFVASGSTLMNEYGVASDWIELYNTGDSAINFATHNYYITDDSTTKDKFKIDNLSIPGKGFMVVFCDDSVKITTQVHTGFKLSSAGEFVGLYKKDGSGNFVALTERPFGAWSSGTSEGRLPDGGTTWTTFPLPTPGASNH